METYSSLQTARPTDRPHSPRGLGLPALSRRLSSGRGRLSDPEHEPGASPGRSPGRLAPLRRDWAEKRRRGGRLQHWGLTGEGREGRTQAASAAPQSPMMRARKQLRTGRKPGATISPLSLLLRTVTQKRHIPSALLTLSLLPSQCSSAGLLLTLVPCVRAALGRATPAPTASGSVPLPWWRRR